MTKHALLNADVPGETNAWCAGVLDTKQWAGVSLIIPRKVVKIATRARKHDSYNQWVTSYRVQYTLDGITWQFAENGKLY
jgi:F5/8 type C domain